jgi:heptosyltransferase-2
LLTRKSLIVKLGAIGDVATVLPAARKLFDAGSQIDWLCGRAVAPLLSCYSWVNPIVADDAILFGRDRLKAIAEVVRTWRKVSAASYDLCAVLQYDRRFRILTVPVRAKRKVALDLNQRAFKLVSERHHTAEYVRILCGLKDEYRDENYAPLQPDTLPENPLARTGRTRIALAPGGARNLIREDPQRRWPVESYVKLANLLLSKGYEVVLTGGPGDDWVEPGFYGLAVTSAIGKWTIPQTLAFYNSCDCVVTHDSGPLHLAGLSQSPLVGLFGPTAPSKFLPRRPSVVGLWGGERLACRPCYDGREYAPCNWNGCMIEIVPQRVIAAIECLLAHPGSDWRVENL